MASSAQAPDAAAISEAYEILNIASKERTAFRAAVRQYIGAHLDVCDRLKVPNTAPLVAPVWGRFGKFATEIRQTALRLDFEIAIEDANEEIWGDIDDAELVKGCDFDLNKGVEVDRAFIEKRIQTSYQALEAMNTASRAAFEKMK